MLEYRGRAWFANKRIRCLSLLAVGIILMFMFQQFLLFGTIQQLIQTTIKASASDLTLEAGGEFILANGTSQGLKNSSNFFHVKTLGKCSSWEYSFWQKTDYIIDQLPE